MSSPLRIGIVVGTTRQNRFADKPAEWLLNIARKRDDSLAAFELIDLRDYPMPFFDEPVSPLVAPSKNEIVQRWASTVRSLDGFVFITAEYNHGVPAVLKNAIDHVYPEFVRKPAAFVAYGNAGGARAVEQLRAVLAELQVAPVRSAVHIGYAEFIGMLMQGRTFNDYPYLEQSAGAMLDDLLWWARTLRSGRELNAA